MIPTLPPADRQARTAFSKAAIELRPVVAIALEEDPLRRRHLRLVDVLGREELRDPEVGVHRPLAVGAHQHHAAPGLLGMVAGCERRRIVRPLRPQVVREDRPELVVLHLPHIGRSRPERRQAGDGVGRRASRDLPGRPHMPVEIDRPPSVDQLHDAALDAVLGEEAVLDMAQHVHEGIADPNHLVSLGHKFFSSKVQMSRIRQAGQAGLRARQV